MTEDRLSLADLLAKAGDGDFLRSVAEAVVQLLMETDVEGVIGAGRHERTGSRAVYATIDAVETFVDLHYEEQIRKLPAEGPGGALRAALQTCQEDEVHHRDEARALRQSAHGGLLRLWVWAVGAGSKAAVSAGRRI